MRCHVRYCQLSVICRREGRGLCHFQHLQPSLGRQQLRCSSIPNESQQHFLQRERKCNHIQNPKQITSKTITRDSNYGGYAAMKLEGHGKTSPFPSWEEARWCLGVLRKKSMMHQEAGGLGRRGVHFIIFWKNKQNHFKK